VRQYENTAEALRQRSIAELFGTFGLESQMGAQAIGNRRTAAEAARLEALQPGVARAQEAETQARVIQALTGAASLPSELAYRKALTEQAQSSAANQVTPAERLREQERDEAIARAGIGVQQQRLAQEDRQFEETRVPMEFDQTDGTTLIRKVPAGEVKAQLAAGGRLIDQARKDQRTAQRLESKARQEEIDSALGSEATILSTKDKDQGGGLMVDDPAVIADISNFNAKSDKPYIYVYDPQNPERKWGENFTYKIPLVDDEGKRHEARDVAQRAKELGYATVEEYVRLRLYKGRKMPKVPVRR
jgi:hypothetical protein